MLTLSSPTIVHRRFNDNRWLVFSFIVVIIILVKPLLISFFLHFLNFSFCKYVSSHPTSICSKLVLLPVALLLTEQILAGWDSSCETIDVSGDCEFYLSKVYMCLYIYIYIYKFIYIYYIYIYIIYIIYIWIKKHTKFIKITNISFLFRSFWKGEKYLYFNKFCVFFLFVYIWSHAFKVGISFIHI